MPGADFPPRLSTQRMPRIHLSLLYSVLGLHALTAKPDFFVWERRFEPRLSCLHGTLPMIHLSNIAVSTRLWSSTYLIFNLVLYVREGKRKGCDGSSWDWPTPEKAGRSWGLSVTTNDKHTVQSKTLQVAKQNRTGRGMH